MNVLDLSVPYMNGEHSVTFFMSSRMVGGIAFHVKSNFTADASCQAICLKLMMMLLELFVQHVYPESGLWIQVWLALAPPLLMMGPLFRWYWPYLQLELPLPVLMKFLVVLALPAAGAASADEVIDCTSEEKDYEANATPPLFVSPEKTENPGGPGTTLGAEPLNLLSLIDENYFCPEASYRSLQMKCRALQETGQKEVIQNSVGVMGKGMVETTEAPHSDLTYLFEKELAASDCDVNIGQLMIPRSYVEAYFLTPDQRGTSIRITDIEGKVWSFELLSCAYTNNRTHVLGGTLKCIREMQWEIGDTLKFYRNELDEKIVMELKKIDTGAPSK